MGMTWDSPTRPQHDRTREFVKAPDSDGLHRGLGVEDFIVDAACDRSPIHMVNVVKVLAKRNPLRMRRMRKDMAWLEAEARWLGVANPPVPEWLKS